MLAVTTTCKLTDLSYFMYNGLSFVQDRKDKEVEEEIEELLNGLGISGRKEMVQR